MDINLVQHAKDYIDDLAKGINPFTKSEINEEDIVNNVKISRCLFYVSDILSEVIINGGITKAAKQKKSSFSADALDLNKIELSQVPITISVLAKSINALKPEEMENLKVTAITNWLVDINFLQIIQINGKNYKRPTAKGIAICHSASISAILICSSMLLSLILSAFNPIAIWDFNVFSTSAFSFAIFIMASMIAFCRTDSSILGECLQYFLP